MYFILFAVGIAALVLLLACQFFGSRRSRPSRSKGFSIPPGVVLSSRPLMTSRDVHLYNMINLAARDRYFVFAQVPLPCVVNVKGEGKARMTVLSQIALKRVDFVLIHPGSRLVERAVLVEAADATEGESEWQRAVEAALQASGIPYLRLKASAEDYTVPTLMHLLGLASEE